MPESALTATNDVTGAVAGLTILDRTISDVLRLAKADDNTSTPEVLRTERRMRRGLRGVFRGIFRAIQNDLQWDALNSLHPDAKALAYGARSTSAGARVTAKGEIGQLIGQVPMIETDLAVDMVDQVWLSTFRFGYNSGGTWTARLLAAGQPATFELRDPNVLLAIQQRTRNLSSVLVHSELAPGVASWLTNEMYEHGANPRTLRRHLTTRGYADVGRWRADRIGRTEALIAVEQGKFDTASRSGVAEIEWQAHLDDSTRESHRNIDGSIIKLGDTFPNGLRYPGDWQGPAREIVNCRCTSAPVAPDIRPEDIWLGGF